MILAAILIGVVVVIVIGAIAASQEAPSQAAQEEKRGAICSWCREAKDWYSALKWYKKLAYIGWRATTQVYCLGNGCGW